MSSIQSCLCGTKTKCCLSASNRSVHGLQVLRKLWLVLCKTVQVPQKTFRISQDWVYSGLWCAASLTSAHLSYTCCIDFTPGYSPIEHFVDFKMEKAKKGNGNSFNCGLLLFLCSINYTDTILTCLMLISELCISSIQDYGKEMWVHDTVKPNKADGQSKGKMRYIFRSRYSEILL